MKIRHSDNLAKSLQSTNLCAAEGRMLAKETVKTFESLRNPEEFAKIWESIKSKSEKFSIDEPKLPRKRKRPAKYDDCQTTFAGSLRNANSIFEYFQDIYNGALDTIIKTISERFESKSHEAYENLESLLLKSANGENYEKEVEFVCKFYQSDIDQDFLEAQLVSFKQSFSKEKGITLSDIKEIFEQPGKKEFLSEIYKVLRLILVISASNAGSERVFSKLRLTKSYLRSTMNQDRLNHLMVLSTHKQETDALCLKSVCNEFVKRKETRLKMFGLFDLT